VARNIKAVYAELVVPVIKDLELQLAVRRDDYSVIGATTNPKVAFRYQPDQLAAAARFGQQGLPGAELHPAVRRPPVAGTAERRGRSVGCAAHPGDARFCAIERLDYFSGGNPKLRPETSKQGTLGFVVEPIQGLLGLARLLGDQRQGPHPEPHAAGGAGQFGLRCRSTSSAMPTAPSTTSTPAGSTRRA
jgi:outer membrane receptor protein involved in Fe transport